MLKNLPPSLLEASQTILDEDDLCEDNLSAEDKPDEDKPKDELSGETEDVIINPQYKTFSSRRPR